MARDDFSFTKGIEILANDSFHNHKVNFYNTINTPDLAVPIANFFTQKIDKCLLSLSSMTPLKIRNSIQNEITSSVFWDFCEIKIKNSSPPMDTTTRSPLSSKLERMTPYQVLDLPSTASQSEIRKSYLKLSLKHHSDKVHKIDIETPPEFESRKQNSAERMIFINRAYSTLKDL